MIRNSGVEPTIIYYLETPPTKNVLVQLIVDMKITVRALLRKNVEPYEQLNLEQDSYTDDQLIDFMLQYPILVNRPIVVTPLGAVDLCIKIAHRYLGSHIMINERATIDE